MTVPAVSSVSKASYLLSKVGRVTLSAKEILSLAKFFTSTFSLAGKEASVEALLKNLNNVSLTGITRQKAIIDGLGRLTNNSTTEVVEKLKGAGIKFNGVGMPKVVTAKKVLIKKPTSEELDSKKHSRIVQLSDGPFVISQLENSVKRDLTSFEEINQRLSVTLLDTTSLEILNPWEMSARLPFYINHISQFDNSFAENAESELEECTTEFLKIVERKRDSYNKKFQEMFSIEINNLIKSHEDSLRIDIYDLSFFVSDRSYIEFVIQGVDRLKHSYLITPEMKQQIKQVDQRIKPKFPEIIQSYTQEELKAARLCILTPESFWWGKF